jgi:hypothetical protein
MKKTPRWKQPPKLRSERTKKFKEKRPKHVRPTQNSAWKRLEEFFLQNRIRTLQQCGFTEEEILDYLKNTNYYDRYRKYS